MLEPGAPREQVVGTHSSIPRFGGHLENANPSLLPRIQVQRRV